MTLSGLSFTLCSVFFSRWIIASVVLLLTCPGHVMTQHMVNYRISEELPRGTLIGSLATHLPLPLKTKLPQLRFRSIQSEHAQYFHVNISTGELRVRMRLDRETICPILIEGVSPTELLRRASISQDTVCQLSFRVNILRVTQSGVEIKNLIRVVITLDDVDDNRCQFIPSNNQELYIPENVNGTTYDLHLPVDLDTEPRNNINKTSISLHTHSNGTIKHPFGLSIDKTESVIAPYQIKLVVLEPMDYEQVRQYKMIVYVSGSTVNSECRLDLIVHVLDTNDHAPVFVRKTDRLSLSENTTIGQPFYTVKAIDDDVGPVYGALRFLLSPSNSPQLHLTFAIHERNGSVYLKRALNYGQQSSYKLSLRVQNPEETGSAFLGSNRMYTSSSSSLDVRAMNLGKSDNLMDEMDLYIDVIDVNDHWPEIVIYALNGSRQITLAEHIESIPADFAVVSVTKWFELTRIDQNPLVTVTAASENQTTSDTNGNRGALYKLAALRSFDREVETIVNFRVVCEDHGNPRLTSNMTGILWILDLNDHSPEFPVTTVHMQVNEDSDPTRHLNDFVIGQINATDKDSGENAKLRYSLVEPELQHLITIDPINGLMRSKGLLDFETNQTILFTVAATDMGNPPRTASCRVHLKVLDYNDHAPEFEQSDYDFSVQENLPQGFPIGSIQVCDRDVGINAVMNFRLSQMETPEMLFTHTSASQLYPPRTQIPFRLSSQYASHSECYKVVLLTSSPLNREANLELANRSQNDHVYLSRPYQFYVIAEDRGSPALTARARIQIRVTDVNDEAPVFVEPSILHRSMLVTVYQPIDVEIFRVSPGKTK
ncbi:unnamed protein product [Echinostoma caproni]|uniref:Cadherin n=1 Tax=Echinostoma caproni TaxID=27848 RepID=A0A183B611_9TREM|nr:unnamed protein product [Echinostoma caproni]